MIRRPAWIHQPVLVLSVAIFLMIASNSSLAFIQRGAQPIHIDKSIDLIDHFDNSISCNPYEVLEFWNSEVHSRYLGEGWSFADPDERDVYPWPYLSENPCEIILQLDYPLDRTLSLKFVNIGLIKRVDFITATINGQPVGTTYHFDLSFQIQFLIPASLQVPGSNRLVLEVDPAYAKNRPEIYAIGLHSVKIEEGAYVRSPLQFGALIRPSIVMASPVGFGFEITSQADFIVEFDMGYFQLPESRSPDDPPFSLAVSLRNRDGEEMQKHELVVSRENSKPQTWSRQKIRFTSPENGELLLMFQFSNPARTVSTAYLGLSEVRIYPSSRYQLAAPKRKTPDILLITIGNLHADSLSSYGDYRSQTPFFDILASNTIQFMDVVSGSNGETSAIVSIFSGQYPISHNIYHRNSFSDFGFEVYPQILQKLGYRSYGIFVNCESDLLLTLPNMAGFDEYHVVAEMNSSVLERYQQCLNSSRLGISPVNIWIHVSIPLSNDEPRIQRFYSEDYGPEPIILEEINIPPEDQRRVKDLIPYRDHDLRKLQVMYDSNIARLDSILESIIRYHSTRRPSANLMVAVSATNGIIRFSPDNPFSTDTLSQEVIHVPVYIGSLKKNTTFWKTGLDAQVRSSRVIYPYLLSQASIAEDLIPPQMQLKSINDSDNAVFSEHDRRRIMAIRNNNWKLIYCFNDPYHRISFSNLFNLVVDPAERSNLIGKYPHLRDEFVNQIMKFADSNPIYPEPQKGLMDEANEVFRSLNYMQ